MEFFRFLTRENWRSTTERSPSAKKKSGWCALVARAPAQKCPKGKTHFVLNFLALPALAALQLEAFVA